MKIPFPAFQSCLCISVVPSMVRLLITHFPKSVANKPAMAFVNFTFVTRGQDITKPRETAERVTDVVIGPDETHTVYQAFIRWDGPSSLTIESLHTSAPFHQVEKSRCRQLASGSLFADPMKRLFSFYKGRDPLCLRLVHTRRASSPKSK